MLELGHDIILPHCHAEVTFTKKYSRKSCELMGRQKR